MLAPDAPRAPISSPSRRRRTPRARTRPARRLLAGLAAGGVAAFLAAEPAASCGGLVGENGTIELVRTTTFAAYHDGVERYVTSFEFTGEGEEVGSIIPLPDVPTKVERGGDWTLQRLQLEISPPEESARAASLDAAGGEAEVILETEIDALDITVLKGGADEVGRWAVENGFLLTPDAPEVLRFYAERSPVFMAARFDASRAADLGQQAGDGTPIMLTIPTDDPWVPLRILGLGLDDDQQVEADVFLLTDQRPQLLAGGEGLTLSRSEQAGDGLLADLRSDVGMEWVPEDMWFTHLPLSVEAGALDYDLAVSTDDEQAPAVTDAGISARAAVPITGSSGSGAPWWPLALGVLAAGTVAAGVSVVRVMARAPEPAVAPTPAPSGLLPLTEPPPAPEDPAGRS